jgi:hypothetical protein
MLEDNLLSTRERAERKKTDQFKIKRHPSGYTKCSHNSRLKYATTKELDIPKLSTMKWYNRPLHFFYGSSELLMHNNSVKH